MSRIALEALQQRGVIISEGSHWDTAGSLVAAFKADAELRVELADLEAFPIGRVALGLRVSALDRAIGKHLAPIINSNLQLSERPSKKCPAQTRGRCRERGGVNGSKQRTDSR